MASQKPYQAVSLILLLFLFSYGCKKEEPLKDPENKEYTSAQIDIIKLRNQYKVKLNGWQPREAENHGPPELILDIAVVNENRDRRLSNLTVLVTQFDKDGNPLREDRLSLPVGDLTPNSSHFITGRGLDCAENLDGVIVKLEPNPAVRKLGEYKEFY